VAEIVPPELIGQDGNGAEKFDQRPQNRVAGGYRIFDGSGPAFAVVVGNRRRGRITVKEPGK
jgi:hypothetical protein